MNVQSFHTSACFAVDISPGSNIFLSQVPLQKLLTIKTIYLSPSPFHKAVNSWGYFFNLLSTLT